MAARRRSARSTAMELPGYMVAFGERNLSNSIDAGLGRLLHLLPAMGKKHSTVIGSPAFAESSEIDVWCLRSPDASGKTAAEDLDLFIRPSRRYCALRH